MNAGPTIAETAPILEVRDLTKHFLPRRSLFGWSGASVPQPLASVGLPLVAVWGSAVVAISASYREARSSTRLACVKWGRSTIFPSTDNTPAPGCAANASTMARACATSSAEGVKAALITATCAG